MRTRLALAVLAALLWTAAPAFAAEDLVIESTDTSRYPDVSVVVRLPDQLIDEDLPADAFAVYENGSRIAAGVWTGAQEAIDVVLVVDTSGSMEGDPIADARAAAEDFIARVPATARVAVIGFGDKVEVHHPLDDDHIAATAAVGGLEASGETALYDAIVAATGLLDEAYEARRVVVVLSDGGDTVSATSQETAEAELAVSTVELHVVALPSDEADRSALDALAAAAGGRVIAADEAAALGDVYRDIAESLIGRYRIAYTTETGGSTVVTVRVRHGSVDTRAHVTLEFPGLPGLPVPPTSTSPPIPAEVPAEPVAPSPRSVPETIVMKEPGGFGAPWAMPAGVATLMGGVLVAVALALRGKERPAAVPGVEAEPKRRWFGALASRLTRRAETAAEGVLGAERASSLDKSLDRAGLAMRPAEFVVLAASVALALTFGALVAFGPAGGLVAVTVSLLGPRALLRFFAGRRRAAFADQFEASLQMIAGSLRAGYGLLQAVSTVASEAPSPTAEEFGRVSLENQLGRSVEDSLRAMATRMGNEDLYWVVEAIEIQYEVGGDMAEVLDTVGETIRDRNQIRRQVKALSAEGRFSAIILIALPFVLALLIGMVSPDYLAELTGTGPGRLMILAGLVLIGIGAAWIKRIVKVVF